MAKDGVVGTAIGLNEKGSHTILILLDRAGLGGIPNELEGVPVQHLVTGKIEALAKPASKGVRVDPTARFARPVPIGVSTGNAASCSAGTIGCRLVGGFALSNNHVYALENNPGTGTIVQPGLYDTRCVYNETDNIGTLSTWIPINFGGTNTVDVAIANCGGNLSRSTPSDGYGTPKRSTAAAYVGMPVQKYGRTTGLTSGKVYALNAIVNVTYDHGTAKFINQILVTPGSFIKAGDSGSLMVTKDRNATLNAKPVGLLFAGGSTIAVANPIDAVLAAVGKEIDGE
jgi:hypothetical protein